MNLKTKISGKPSSFEAVSRSGTQKPVNIDALAEILKRTPPGVPLQKVSHPLPASGSPGAPISLADAVIGQPADSANPTNLQIVSPVQAPGNLVSFSAVVSGRLSENSFDGAVKGSDSPIGQAVFSGSIPTAVFSKEDGAQMAETEDIQSLVCDNGTGMIKHP
ncbi:hypothetical protein OROMI_012765 [Orobanche minor]